MTIQESNLNRDEAIQKQLAPPGAGIPWYHRLVLKLYVGPFVSAKAKWGESEKTFSKVNSRILKEIEGLSEKDLAKRVLVPSQMGLEDSSRYWSVAMTLEHLVIVGEAITKGITMLSAGQVPPIKPDTAKVKPLGAMPVSQSLKEFNSFTSENFQKFLQTVKDKDSKLSLAHPWFGPFNANQWFWLLGMHGGIHLKQIREIKKRL